MARLLDPPQFAAVLAIVSALAIVAFPANAFQTAVAVGSGRLSADGKSSQLGAFALRASIVGGAPLFTVALLTFIFREPVGRFFGFDGTVIVLWICASLILAMCLAAYRGVLQGSQKFTSLGVVTLAEATLRLLGAVVLVLGGLGIVGATAGFPIGLGFALAIAAWTLRARLDRDAGIHISLWPTIARESRALPAMLAVFGTQAIDIVIANSRLQDEDLEAYSAAALAGRIVFYAGLVVCLLVLPRYRHMFSDRQFDKRLVPASFGAIACICIGGITAGLAFPQIIHSVLVGSSYSADTDLMRVYLVGSSALTCALFLTTIIVAASWTRVAFGIVPIAIGQTLAYAVSATTGIEFAQVLTVASGAMVLVLGCTMFALFRSTAWDTEAGPP